MPINTDERDVGEFFGTVAQERCSQCGHHWMLPLLLLPLLLPPLLLLLPLLPPNKARESKGSRS